MDVLYCRCGSGYPTHGGSTFFITLGGGGGSRWKWTPNIFEFKTLCIVANCLIGREKVVLGLRLRKWDYVYWSGVICN